MNIEQSQLLQRLERLEADNTQMKSQFRNDRRRSRWQMGLALAAVMGAIFLSPANRSALAQVYGVTLALLVARMTTGTDDNGYPVATGIYASVSGGINNTANGGYGIFGNGGPWDGLGPTWVAASFSGR